MAECNHLGRQERKKRSKKTRGETKRERIRWEAGRRNSAFDLIYFLSFEDGRLIQPNWNHFMINCDAIIISDI